ncbi:MAG: DUF47 domain-containing protein [Saccharofermentanales bacterium]
MGNMITRKNVDYFEMFASGISISLKAANLLRTAFADDIIDDKELAKIKEVEHEGDRYVHASLKTVEAAFITPIDRTDIIEIIKGIENVTDCIDNISNHIYMMCITGSDCYMRDFIGIVVTSCERLNDLMIALKQFKKNPNNNIMDLIIEVNRLEEEGDRIFQESMRNLFKYETNVLTVIKNKELYKLFERAIDSCEDIADMIEKVMITKI